jgi:hypothetical protein
MSKNEDAWKVLFEKHSILDQIERTGNCVITSEQINKYRESRLMTKFDHQANLPEIFRKNSLSILPISRGSYTIGRYETYTKQKFDRNIKTEEFDFPVEIESINPTNIFSESAAISSAYLSGMIDTIAHEQTFPTVSGKMSSSKFSFQINGLDERLIHNISIDNSQCEIDGAFEGRESLVLVEAKNVASEDFITRQLYFPYRLWCDKVSKKVIPVYLCYSNDVFYFFVYKFENYSDYNSIRLIEQRNFSFTPEKITIPDIEHILQGIHVVEEPDEPFPQADKFERVVDLLSLLNFESLNGPFITENYDFDPRQTNYYTSAGKYLGLIAGSSEEYSLSKHGAQIMRMSHKAKYLALAKTILAHKVFADTCRVYLSSGRRPKKEDVVEIMKSAHLRNLASDSTFLRRARTILSWVDWVIRLAEPN